MSYDDSGEDSEESVQGGSAGFAASAQGTGVVQLQETPELV